MEANLERNSILSKHFSPEAIGFILGLIRGVTGTTNVVTADYPTAPLVTVDGVTIELDTDGAIALIDPDNYARATTAAPLVVGQVPMCTDDPNILGNTYIGIDTANRVTIDPSGGAVGVSPAALLHVIGSTASTEPGIKSTSTAGATSGGAIFCDGAEVRRHKTLTTADLPYTILPTDNTLLVNVTTGTGNINLTMYAASGNEGRRVRILDMGGIAGTRPIVITANTADRFTGNSTTATINSNQWGVDIDVTSIVISTKQQLHETKLQG